MPTFLKHVGQVSSTGKKCVVVFRTLPGDTTSCLVVETASLDSLYHDDLQNAVENQRAQETIDFYTYAQRNTFHDGRNMLEALHRSGWLRKYPTSEITMKPTMEIGIPLSELNEQLGEIEAAKTTSTDISRNIEDPIKESKPAGVLDDEQIANNMRMQAAQFRAEAERLLKEANELSPISESAKREAVAEAKPKRKYTRKK